MKKWYEDPGQDADVVLASRVRLQRNLQDYRFPIKLDEGEKRRLNEDFKEKFADMGQQFGMSMTVCDLDKLSEYSRQALQDKQIISKSALAQKGPVRLFMSDDEQVSLLTNSDDHLRLQISTGGLNLKGAYALADQLDDYMNESYAYAYDTRFGYMTTFPTNIGTGMRAYAILHLPMLSIGRRFRVVANEFSRYGISVKNMFGEGTENFGNMFVLFNQKTLGQTEQEIVALVSRVVTQVVTQERKMRIITLKTHKSQREDEAYRAYGLLKYSRLLSLKDALFYLSKLQLGIQMGLLPFEVQPNIYEMMMGIHNGALQARLGKPVSEAELEALRSRYVREMLPPLKNS